MSLTRIRWQARLRAADPGLLVAAGVGLLLLGFSLSVDFPRVAYGFQSDESTYYSLAHSLAEDGDFAFERRDLTRVWKEFRTGPEGIFLKRGKTVDVGLETAFPFVSWETADSQEPDRLYYGKSFIYPLAAAPFVWLFGTSGFLVLHALLMAANVAFGYLFVSARSPRPVAIAYTLVFFAASAAPVYFVWLTPEFFNLSMVMSGFFLWCYKEVAPLPDPSGSGRFARFLRSGASDVVAAVLLGVVTFSKPLYVLLILPLLALAALRGRWRHGLAIGAVFSAVVVGLFLTNAAITGELNYQGGDRKTFYGRTGFPFQTSEFTFESVGLGRSTNEVPLEALFNRDAFLHVLRSNLVYVMVGRHTGLVPYFFPGVLSTFLFLLARGRRQRWQWLVGSTIVLSVLALLVYMPHTYSGGGGPIGNRYFMGFYPVLLFLTPPLATLGSSLTALAVGGLFTAQLVLNPFYSSFHPAEHAKSGPYRWLPVELSLLNDLPINGSPSRVRRSLDGDPPVRAYFLDDNAYALEGTAFWVRGESRADIILRAPARLRDDGGYDSLRVERLTVTLNSGFAPTRVVVGSRADRREVTMARDETRVVSIAVGPGLPYRLQPNEPTNYVYLLSIESEAGFVPLFSTGSGDSRFLGVRASVHPTYVRD